LKIGSPKLKNKSGVGERAEKGDQADDPRVGKYLEGRDLTHGLVIVVALLQSVASVGGVLTEPHNAARAVVEDLNASEMRIGGHSR
jgi:hypothetical protein